jgi:hypothetical protein
LRRNKRNEKRRGKLGKRLSESVRRSSNASYENVIVRERKRERERESELERGTGTGTETEAEREIVSGTETVTNAAGDTTRTTHGIGTLRKTLVNQLPRPSYRRKRLSGLNRKL